jgi:3-oxoacyl-[acyl-carrier protein] reductase
VHQLYPDGLEDSDVADIPMGRLGKPEEFAASYVTGTTVAVDGGLTRLML